MFNSQQNEMKTDRPPSPSPPRWRGRDSMELAFQLNKRTLNLLQEAGTQHRELWSRLDSEIVERAAEFPFVILDVNFTDVVWWRAASQCPEEPWQGQLSPAMWPREVARQLMGELLVFAWHTAKWDRRVARLSLGMSPEVAEVVAALTPQQLDIVSGRHYAALRLRWQAHADFWTRLVEASCAGNEQALADIRLYAKLLLSGGLIGR
ncbi:MAG TPA: hypothetical protein VI653_26330 [Steroidobacteraceae bacterium]